MTLILIKNVVKWGQNTIKPGKGAIVLGDLSYDIYSILHTLIYINQINSNF